MKTIRILLVMALFTGFLISCKNKIGSPEPYTDYISMQISKSAAAGQDSERVVQIYIRNDSDKEFEKECIMTYSLQDRDAGKYYYSERLLFNKLIPDLPNGVFNLTYRDTYIYNINLNDLKWNNLDFSNIESGNYAFDAQLFIKDPYSPMNIIHSNSLNVLKE
jgi:hypothetical protein